jgi:hypothetical protein
VFAAGQTSKEVDVTVKGDFLDEGDETLTLTLSAPFNADLGTSVATGTITNDDAGPKLSIADASVAEGNSGTTPLVFAFTMTPASGSDVTVDYATADGTATAGTDYEAANGTLTIKAGQTSGSITVNVAGDTTPEPNETLTVTLSAPVGAKVVPPTTATGTITNDDRFPTALTLRLVKRSSTIKAKGVIEAATTGMKIKVGLYHKVGAKYVLVSAETVTVKSLGDRDGDGTPDAAYAAPFARPTAGSYRFVARYAGTASYAPCKKALSFKL